MLKEYCALLPFVLHRLVAPCIGEFTWPKKVLGRAPGPKTGKVHTPMREDTLAEHWGPESAVNTRTKPQKGKSQTKKEKSRK